MMLLWLFLVHQGYHNFLWGFIDSPDKNLPQPIDWHQLELLFRWVEMVVPSVSTQFVVEAMNFRLGGSYQGFSDLTSIYNAAAAKGMTFGDLVTIPEQDSWIYRCVTHVGR